MKKFFLILVVLVMMVGTVWLFYDITVPTFICQEVNRTPVEAFGQNGVLKNTEPEILGRIFRYQVIITNLSLSWREYKSNYGWDDYVHSYVTGGATILTDCPHRVWEYIEGNKRWVRKFGWPIE
jgi:hypothetical protein